MTGSMDLLRIVIVVVVVTIGIQTEEICAFAPSVSITTTTTTALSAIAGLEEPGRTVSAGLTCARVGGTVSFSSTGTKGKTAASSSLSLSPVSERIVAAAKAAQNNEQAGDTNVISVTDTNYRALFNSDQPLLLDAYAQWYVTKLLRNTLYNQSNDRCVAASHQFSYTPFLVSLFVLLLLLSPIIIGVDRVN